jgi:hypothetical protein
MKKNIFYALLVVWFLVFPIELWAKTHTIAEIQGEKGVSPLEGKQVSVQGIVTARVRNGFYIQTPDTQVDSSSKTSEGLLVFTQQEPPAEATIGNLVEVSGLVVEFRPKSEPVTLPITELKFDKRQDTIKVISKENALPKPFVLTATDLDPKGAIDQLERYEGMRLKISSLTVCAPTGGRNDEKTITSVSDGVFSGVLTGAPRPFREPGLELFEAVANKFPETIPRFDGNPEILRVDSDAQLGAQTIDVTSNATIKNLVGVLDYAYRTYTLLPDASGTPVISGNILATAVPTPTDKEFTVASFNVERFFDDIDAPEIKEPITTREAFQNRLKKASLAIRDYLKTPDILALVEVENLPTLQKIADKINADLTAAGKTNIKYEAFLLEGNDIGGIDSGFLVNTNRVKVIEVTQLGKDEMFKNPSFDKGNVPVFDRPSLVLRAEVKNGDKTFPVTAIANHLKSLRGITDEKEGEGVRLKRKLQAEFMARFLQSRQTANPNERLVLAGDFNAFQFTDGLVDVIGAIKGKPAVKDLVLLPTEDLITNDLTNLVDMISREQRYSYSFAGNAQVLDHVIVNQPLLKHAARFGYARINADFPEIYRNDPNRVERLSDHDAAVAYFSFEEVPQNTSSQNTKR